MPPTHLTAASRDAANAAYHTSKTHLKAYKARRKASVADANRRRMRAERTAVGKK